MRFGSGRLPRPRTRLNQKKGVLLFLKNLLFTVIVPGTVAVYAPLRLASGREGLPAGWGVWQGVALLPLVCGVPSTSGACGTSPPSAVARPHP
jgi:hypothetical protein